jgi:hypothetical protein
LIILINYIDYINILYTHMSIPNQLNWRNTHKDILQNKANNTDVMDQIKKENNETKPLPWWEDSQGWLMSAGLGSLEVITGISAFAPNLSDGPGRVSAVNDLYDMVKLHVVGNTWDTAPAILNRPHDFTYDMYPIAQEEVAHYNNLMNAATRIDDILYGLPSGETVGTNYYKQIEKCKYNIPYISEETNETHTDSSGNTITTKSYIKKQKKEPPWKWMYIRTKPKGDALNRLGTGSKKTKDNGLIFSILEDLIDLNPFRIGRMFKDDTTEKEYINCSSKKRRPDTDIKYFDKYNNELKGKDIPLEETIEMFSNINSVNKYYSRCLTSIFIILVLIVLYKLLI